MVHVLSDMHNKYWSIRFFLMNNNIYYDLFITILLIFVQKSITNTQCEKKIYIFVLYNVEISRSDISLYFFFDTYCSL